MKKERPSSTMFCEARPVVAPRDTLRLRELKPLDFGGVELASVRRKQHDGFADDGRVEADPAVATGVVAARADVARRVDLEARRVVEAIVLDPLLRDRREPLALREPGELHLELVVLDHDGLDLAAVHVPLVLVLDLHLAALEPCDRLCHQLHIRLLSVVVYTISLLTYR